MCLFAQYSICIRNVFRSGLAVLFLFAGGAAVADDLVGEYFAGLHSFQADFTQRVVDNSGQEVQNAQGRVWIEKPGHFRWDYKTPYHQLIVADGEHLWTYDEDLEQASVKAVDDALSSTPAMLLSGYRPLAEVMTWKEVATDDGKAWYVLDPRQTDTAVEQVRIGFSNRQLRVIEVVDGFGNHTRIEFTGVQRNKPIKPGLFQIELPPGTDVIGATP